MRFVAIAIALMTLATVAVTPGLRQDLAGLWAGSHDPDGQGSRQAAGRGLESIPERVLTRLALPPVSEPSSGGEPSEEMPAPSILATALSESPATPTRMARTQIAGLPPAADPLHAQTGEPDWLSTLSPAAPRELIGPETDTPPDKEDEPGQRPPFDPEPDRAESPSAAVPAEEPLPDPTAGELMTALFAVPPLVTGAGPAQGPEPEPSTPAEAEPARPDAAFAGTQLAAAPLPEASESPSAATGPKASGTFVVIGSFLRSVHAERLVGEHASWKPALRGAVVDGKPRHRVVVGPFSSGDWRKALARIRAEAVSDAWPLPAPAESGLVVRSLDIFG